MTSSVKVTVDPVEFRKLRAALYGFDRELLGKLNSRMRRVVAPAKAAAEAEAGGLAGLGPGDHGEGKLAEWYTGGPTSLQVKIGGPTSSGGLDAIVRLISRNKAVSIAEFAQNGRTPQGQGLVRTLERFGSVGRIMWEAVDEHEAQIVGDLRDEVRKTEAEFSARLASGTSAGVLR